MNKAITCASLLFASGAVAYQRRPKLDRRLGDWFSYMGNGRRPAVTVGNVTYVVLANLLMALCVGTFFSLLITFIFIHTPYLLPAIGYCYVFALIGAVVVFLIQAAVSVL